MKVESWVFFGLGLIITPWAIVYWVFSDDKGGIALLVVLALATLFLAVYLLAQAREVREGRPEDRLDADPGDQAGSLGFFPASSAWPIVVAAATMVMAFGFVFSPWILLPGVLLLLYAVVGWAVEVQRAHD